ncbi:MAG: hypothetical protein R2795_22520 [Saprospiraceae bacterium]
MKYILVILLMCNQMVSAQDTLKFDMVEPFSYKFHIQTGRLTGDGADSLMSEILKSHFVLLGETHDDAKIAEFTNHLLSELEEMGYKYFLTEHGRFGLQMFLEDAAKDSTIVSGIHRINSLEYKQLNEFPFPFLTGIEDAQFVETALKLGYQIYGIDQEFFYSFPFIFNKLFQHSSKTNTIRTSYETALNYLLGEYEKDVEQEDYPICAKLLESKEIQTFFDHLSTEPDLQIIVNDIRQSWEIYEANRTNRQQSFVMRGALMKNRFITFYDSTSTSSNSKYIIKLGARHTMRGTTPLGIEDIGEMVHQTALKNGQKDLNICFMFRYYLDEEEELGYFDNSEGNSAWLNERKPLMLQGEPDRWTIIDLRKLKNAVESNELFVFQPINDMMNRHDYLIIPPASRDVIENMKTE